MAQTSIQAGQLLSRCQRGRSRRPGRSLRAAASPRYTAVLAVCACDKQPKSGMWTRGPPDAGGRRGGFGCQRNRAVVASLFGGGDWLCEAACGAVEPHRLHLFVDVPDFVLKVVDDEGVFVFGVCR